MDIRTAMLKAADKIASDPACYDFQCGDIEGDGPGCLIVWACRIAGHTSGRVTSNASPLGFGYDDLIQYSTKSRFNWRHNGGAPTNDPAAGAALLREYANKHFPAYPNWQAIATAPLGSQTAGAAS